MKLVITEKITLDGVVEATDGWFAPAGDDDGADTSDIETNLRQVMAWEHTTVVRGDLAAEVGALKEAPGGDLGVTGSISVARHLIAARLVVASACSSTAASPAA